MNSKNRPETREKKKLKRKRVFQLFQPNPMGTKFIFVGLFLDKINFKV